VSVTQRIALTILVSFVVNIVSPGQDSRLFSNKACRQTDKRDRQIGAIISQLRVRQKVHFFKPISTGYYIDPNGLDMK